MLLWVFCADRRALLHGCSTMPWPLSDELEQKRVVQLGKDLAEGALAVGCYRALAQVQSAAVTKDQAQSQV